jgi:hypothetical protein
MDIAALVVWIVTALGGFVLLGTWVSHGGHRPAAPGGATPPSRLPPGVVFGHFLLAATGLVLWIIYVAADVDALAWVAFALVVVVALLGFTMFARWLPQVRGDRGVTTASDTAEHHFPVAVVLLHGLVAATTVVLVLLAAADV